jgi:hypothetical protein
MSIVSLRLAGTFGFPVAWHRPVPKRSQREGADGQLPSLAWSHEGAIAAGLIVSQVGCRGVSPPHD